MKIIVIHNRHRSGSASGDDLVFERESQLLQKYGHRVTKISPSNDEFDGAGPLGKFLTVLQIPWSISSYNHIMAVISETQPDIVHIHNFFPLLSPSIYYAVNAASIPVIQTLHDFRLLCSTGFCSRGGDICDLCVRGSFVNSVKYGCFRKSRMKSLPVALMLEFHRACGTFKRKIDAFVCLTESQRRILLSAGFPEDRLFLKPNFVEAVGSEDTAVFNGEYVVYVGRLGEEKGIRTLVKAWIHLPGIPLKLIGDGPDRGEVESLVRRLGIRNIDFCGYKSHRECMNILGHSRFLVMPSIWHETFGLATIEAFVHSKPVVASNLGAMADAVVHGHTGLLFTPKDSEELAQKVQFLWDNPDLCTKLGKNARKEYEMKYTPEKNYEMLMDIYSKAIEKHKTRR